MGTVPRCPALTPWPKLGTKWPDSGYVSQILRVPVLKKHRALRISGSYTCKRILYNETTTDQNAHKMPSYVTPLPPPNLVHYYSKHS